MSCSQRKSKSTGGHNPITSEAKKPTARQSASERLARSLLQDLARIIRRANHREALNLRKNVPPRPDRYKGHIPANYSSYYRAVKANVEELHAAKQYP